MRETKQNKSKNAMNVVFYLCVFLSCMVPRYISTFKIHLGINISLYTVAVAVFWIVFSHQIRFYRMIESWIFPIWFLFVLFSVWRAERIGIWTYYLIWTLTSVLFMQCIYTCDRKEVFDTAIKALVLGLLIHLLIGLYEVQAHRYLFQVGDFSRRYYGTTAISIFHNPNDYVTFVVTLVPFAFYRFYQNENLFARILYVFIISASVYLIIKSESRGGFFSLVIFAVALIVLFFRKSSTNKLISICGLLLIIIVGLFIPSVRSYVMSVFNINRIDVTGTDVSRVNLIKNGLYFLRQTYGFGVGAGNLIVWLTERSIYYIGRLGFIHNWYMELLCTFGIVFFAIYTIFHVKILTRLSVSYNRNSEFWNLNNTFLISFIGFSIISISSSSNIYSEWIWMYLVLISAYCSFNCKPIRKRRSMM